MDKEDVCNAHSGFAAKIEKLEKTDEEMWRAIDKLRNRLPVWCTLLLSVLTFLLGAGISYAALAVRVSEVIRK